MRPVFSSAAIVFSKSGARCWRAIRSTSARFSAIAAASAGSNSSTRTRSNGGTPPYGPVHGCSSGLSLFGIPVLESLERLLQLPLQARFHAPFDQRATAARHRDPLVRARGDVHARLAVAPQAFTRQECILERIARHSLQCKVAEAVFLYGLQVLQCQVGAEHAFVIRRQRDRHVVLQVQPQGMRDTTDAEYGIVAAQRDLDEHVTAC